MNATGDVVPAGTDTDEGENEPPTVQDGVITTSELRLTISLPGVTWTATACPDVNVIVVPMA